MVLSCNSFTRSQALVDSSWKRPKEIYLFPIVNSLVSAINYFVTFYKLVAASLNNVTMTLLMVTIKSRQFNYSIISAYNNPLALPIYCMMNSTHFSFNSSMNQFKFTRSSNTFIYSTNVKNSLMKKLVQTSYIQVRQ